MTRFCIIDISNLVHRAKHGAGQKIKVSHPYDPFADEEDTSRENVMIGLVLTSVFNGLLTAFYKFKADHVVAAFDLRSWRRDFFEDYKGNRRDKVRTPQEEADHELINRIIDEVRDFLRDYTNVTVLETIGAEADDFIARWTQIHNDPVFHHTIISADSDFKQLISPTVELYNPMSNTLYTTYGVFFQDGRKKRREEQEVELYGQSWKVKLDKTGEPETIEPEWELFEKCIRGDTNDNIQSAWPRVTTVKMRKAFEGDVAEYNNFINSTWGKDGEKNSVRELYEWNRTLIDLTRQPPEIIDMMDDTIADALDLEPARMIGAYFGKFCGKYKLTRLTPRAEQFVHMLSKRYPS